MKKERLKIALAVCIILFIIVVGIGGIYVHEKGNWTNILPEYQFATDLKGYRSIGLKVSEATKEIEIEAEVSTDTNTTTENTVAEEKDKEETNTTTTQLVNPEEKRNVDNYLPSKKVVEERLQQISTDNYYTIRQDSYNGNIFIQMVDTEEADELAGLLAQQGQFRIVDSETKEELLNNSHIKDVKVGYSALETGYAVYLNMEFTKEGAEKLKEISNIYVQSSKQEGDSAVVTTKNIDLNIDDETIVTTYFGQEIANGVIQLSIGEETTSYEELQNYLMNATRMAVVLGNGEMPLAYEVDENAYNGTYLTTEHVKAIFMAAGIVLGLLIIAMIVILKKKAVIGILSFVGYIAAFLLTLRFTNVYISLETMAGMVVATLLAYIAILKFLTMPKTEEKVQKQFLETYKQVVLYMIPIAIIAITLCFAKWLPLYNFGMAIFWGIALVLAWNAIFTRIFLVNQKQEEAREEGK